MTRYVVLQNDSLTGGGRVIDAVPNGLTLGNLPAAYVGGSALCFVCGKVGKIVAAGERGSMKQVNGYTLALNGDLVICACPVPPCLVNSSTQLGVG